MISISRALVHILLSILLLLWISGGGDGQQASAADMFKSACNSHVFLTGDDSFGCVEDVLRTLIKKVSKSAIGPGFEDQIRTCPSRTVIKATVNTGGASDAENCLNRAMNVLHTNCYNNIGARVWRDRDSNVCFIRYDIN
ncbi:unnamed protein product [Linum trigynum]|uniref:Gnk2-homologous domain-containing protein n=1 Tax=Linum trigynum TaxID=586398 RepID=A0AAV2FWC3_9ROSI